MFERQSVIDDPRGARPGKSRRLRIVSLSGSVERSKHQFVRPLDEKTCRQLALHLSRRIIGQVEYRLIAAAVGQFGMLVKPRAMAVDGDLDPRQARTVSQERKLQRVNPARLHREIKLHS